MTRDFEKVTIGHFKKDSYESGFFSKYNEGYIEEIIKEGYEKITIPRRATRRSSGYDFVSPFEFILCPNQTIKFPLGIKAYMQEDEELLIFPRSSVGFNYKVKIDNTIGKIDSDYYNNPKNEGDIQISLTNTGDREWFVKVGDKICQGSFYNYLITDTDNPVKEERLGGMGSTNER